MAEYAALCKVLPWSVEPMPGWTEEIKPNARDVQVRSRPDSPGYAPEQKAELARLRALMLDLSTTVTTHPFWGTLGKGEVVGARMASSTSTTRSAARRPPTTRRPAATARPRSEANPRDQRRRPGGRRSSGADADSADPGA